MTYVMGWGVPTATDISLAWMCARLIFGTGHPAVNFLLLLAIVDDALGMIIIAVVYVDPANPVQPLYLLFVVAGIAVAFGLRKLTFPPWYMYMMLAFPLTWYGLLKGNVHPALALVPVVPFMPASHAEDHSNSDDHSHPTQQKLQMRRQMTRSKSVMLSAMQVLARFHGDHAPLHVFAHTLQLPVDFGMFFFGLSNAGVKLNNFGGLTAAIVFALIIGKMLGIAGFALFAHAIGFRLPVGVTVADVFTMASLGGIGLTVALFMSNEAFVDPGLQGQAKFGAVLSVLSAAVAVVIGKIFRRTPEAQPEKEQEKDAHLALEMEQPVDENAKAPWLDDVLVQDVVRLMAQQRQYRKRGVEISFDELGGRAVSREQATTLAREISKRSVGSAYGDMGPLQRTISKESDQQIHRQILKEHKVLLGATEDKMVQSV